MGCFKTSHFVLKWECNSQEGEDVNMIIKNGLVFTEEGTFLNQDL